MIFIELCLSYFCANNILSDVGINVVQLTSSDSWMLVW